MIDKSFNYKDYVSLTATFLLLLLLPITIYYVNQSEYQDVRGRAQQITPSHPILTPGLQSNIVILNNISTQTATTTATIIWTTNIPSTSRVIYGASSTNLNLSTVENATPVTNHTVVLTGLSSNTRYYYKVISKNSFGDEFSSTVKNFKTKNR